MKHVVMLSGGIGSWAAAKRVQKLVDRKDMLLLFADTRMEDEDLYRFLNETVEEMGVELIRLADGRTPWQVFHDERYLGNSRIDPCSRILKRNLCFRWLKQHMKPEETVVYLGLDWTEIHRFVRAQSYWQPWTVRAPLCEEPYVSKLDCFDMLKQIGIRAPRLYELGFPHNNCGGFCVKAGLAHFRLLLQTLPGRYLFHELQERELRRSLNKDISILRRKKDGKTIPLTLQQWRIEVQQTSSRPLTPEEEEWGGCGCFTDF